MCRPNAVDNEKIFPLQGCSERWLHLFEEACPDDVEHVLRHEACEREPRPDPVQQGVVCSQMRGQERRPAARPGPVTPQQCAQSDGRTAPGTTAVAAGASGSTLDRKRVVSSSSTRSASGALRPPVWKKERSFEMQTEQIPRKQVLFLQPFCPCC